MATNTITSANAVFLISVPDLAIASTQIQGYAADNAFSGPGQKVAEVVQGVDGKKSSGWVPHMYQQSIVLQADSESKALFDLIAQAQDVSKTTFDIYGVITLPGINRSYTLTKGTLTDYVPIPDAKRMLEPTEFSITWESVRPAVI